MNAILQALVNSAIVSALVTVAVWLGMQVAPRRLNAATRYLVWWAVLAIVVLMPLCYLPSGQLPRTVTSSPGPVMVTLIAPMEITGPASPAPRAVATQLTAPRPRPRFPMSIAAGSVPQWVGAAWAVTCLTMLLRLAISWVVLRRRKARAMEAPASLSARLDGWLVQCGSSRRQVLVAVSAEIATPMVAGLSCPCILFPVTLLKALDEAELDQIGLHETAHVVRGDDRALIVQRIVEALFAPHPLVRWVARRIDLEREIACDNYVLRTAGNPRPYAACLTRVAELTGMVRGSVVAVAAADERSHLTRRVDLLLDRSRHTGTRPLKARLAAVVAVIVSLSLVAARAPGLLAFAIPMAREFAAAPSADHAPRSQAAVSPPSSVPPRPAAQTPPRASAPRASRPESPPIVYLSVSVREPRSRVVTGLDKSAFRLFEDGVEQEIAQLHTGDAAVSVGLVVDTGSSMGSLFAQVDDSVRQAIRTANPADEFFVVKFDQEASLAVGLPGGGDQVQRRPMEGRSQREAALFDAVSLAARQMRMAHNSRKAILVITGAATDASNTYPESQRLQERNVITEFVQGNVTVYTCGNEPPAGFLAELSGQTGGRHITGGGDPAALAQMTTRFGIELRSLYALEYRPSNPARDGAYRKVQVELVTKPGLPPLTLDYRPGYYGPQR